MSIELTPDERTFPVTAFILNDDGTYGEYKYENFLIAANDLRHETIVAIIADDQVMDAEITYSTADAHDCKDIYSKSIFWNRKSRSSMTLEELTSHLESLGEDE